MKKRILISLILFFFLSTFISQKNLDFFSRFEVKEIFIENNQVLSDEDVRKELSFLYKKNLFSLKIKKIDQVLDKNTFIESLEIKKIYPNQLKVKIFEKKPIVIIQDKKNKFYYTAKGKIINFIYLKDYKNLPIVFGNKDDFKIFYRELKKINFPFSEIETLYFFETRRWDLKMRTSHTIKLPIQYYTKSLKNFLDIKDNKNFKKYKIFDYRIPNQLILK